MTEEETLRIASDHIEASELDEAKKLLNKLIDQTSNNENLISAKKLLHKAEAEKIVLDPWTAIYSMIFGGISLIIILAKYFHLLTLLISIAAIAFGLISLSKSDKQQLQFGGKTLARIGILLGLYHVFIVSALYLFVIGVQ